MKAFIWNIRSVKSQQAFHRVQMLHNFHKFSFIGLMEPFQQARHINKYKRRLKMDYAKANCNGKIWLFTNHNITANVLYDSAQQLTVQLEDSNLNFTFVITLVYAKCNADERLRLWEDIYQVAAGMSRPWLLGGDFNVVLSPEEKIGGLPVLEADHEDFDTCISSCDLVESPFKGSPFTWWNGRAGNDCIFERLDRILINQEMQEKFNQMEVEHLARTGSDHAPMLLNCVDKITRHKKPFRFLKFWTEEPSFIDVVRQNWFPTGSLNPFVEFKANIKRVKTALTEWSKDTYGDIFKQLIIREDIVKIKEKLFEEVPNAENRAVLQKPKQNTKNTSTLKKYFGNRKQDMIGLRVGTETLDFFIAL